jgi:RNA polymerase sigma-70 factor (ECF subfamily)
VTIARHRRDKTCESFQKWGFVGTTSDNALAEKCLSETMANGHWKDVIHIMPNVEPQRQPGEASEALLGRYGSLVYASALRQTGDSAAAEDITQAVFLVALRKGALPEEGRMAGWLLKVTQYAVKAARRSAARRVYHERQAARCREEDRPGLSTELRTLLDEGLLALGALDREVVVRRYLGGERIDDIARQIGLSENAVSQRVGRALEKLRRWLKRRGLVAPSAMVAGTMTKEATAQMPSGLSAMLAGGSTHQPTAASLLARAVLWRIAMVKVQAIIVTAVVILMLGGLGIGGWLATRPGTSESAAAWPQWDASYSPTVSSVLQEPSDALLEEALEKLEANRQKLKTLHVAGVRRFQEYDPRAGEWVDFGETSKGEAWIDLRNGDRERIELEFEKGTSLEDRSSPLMNAGAGVWDGKQTRWLTTGGFMLGPGGQPLLTIYDVREFDSDWFTGTRLSAALWRNDFYGSNNVKDDYYALGAKALRSSSLKLTVRRVLLDGKQAAMELDARYNAPEIPNAEKFSHRYWFDETRGYALLAHQYGEDGKSAAEESIADELKEVAPGVFYPIKLRGSISYEGPLYRWSVEVAQVTANEPIADERFVLDVPPGVKITHSPLHYASKKDTTTRKTAFVPVTRPQ